MQEFEIRYDGSVVEPQMRKYWEDNAIYKYIPDKSKPMFSIDTPPPTVNGTLHIGHIFSYTQAEIIARYKRMQGFNVFYPFGFDDNGLPSERLVERENKIKARDVSRQDFCKMCIDTTQKYEKEFKELWASMGFSCDWDLLYSTVNENTQKLSQKFFLDLVKKGYAYIKESPVLWCVECQTSIAQAELESKEVESYFNYIPFEVEGKDLEIATTRPELLSGVVAVFINPSDERYNTFIGKMAKVPLYGFEVPILGDEKVGIDKGTGVVMCATFGDTTDVEWYETYNLPYKKVILPDGTISKDIRFIGGMTVKEARAEIIRLLNENNLLLRSEKIVHTVSVHERCGTEVEIIPSRQWYIDILSRKEDLLEIGSKIKWYPEQMQNRYISWVENLKWDWCISRQRYFGVPFPVWYCKKCGKPHFAREDQLPINPLEVKCGAVCECGSTEFIPDSAVLDTWATSSISPFINLETASKYGYTTDDFMPMSVRTQAHEIIRTWAFYSIVRSLYHTNNVPWKDAMICGIVLAKPGEKFSKSKGNSKFSPQELVKECTADFIRYGVANVKLGTDTFFDQQNVVETSQRFITKLWNSCKFVLSHLTDFNPNYAVKNNLPIDQWIISKTNIAIVEAKKYLDCYEVGLARKVIDTLFWNDLCDNYIEIVKERLYQPDIHGVEERKSAQHAIYYCLLNVLKMYAIYVPHVTEYIYLKGFKDFVGSKSIHTTRWEQSLAINDEALLFGEDFVRVVSEARKYKSANGLSMRAEIEELTVSTNSSNLPLYSIMEKDLIACTRAKKITYINKT